MMHHLPGRIQKYSNSCLDIRIPISALIISTFACKIKIVKIYCHLLRQHFKNFALGEKNEISSQRVNGSYCFLSDVIL